RIRTGDGRTLLFGQTPDTREADGARVFAWCLDEERDAAGNAILYSYRRDAGRLYPEEVHYSIFRVRFICESRPDQLRNGRSGFERQTKLRARSIELHADTLMPTLMRTYGLEYTAAGNGASLLTRVTLTASDGEQEMSSPELTFEYSDLDLTAWQVHEI